MAKRKAMQPGGPNLLPLLLCVLRCRRVGKAALRLGADAGEVGGLAQQVVLACSGPVCHSRQGSGSSSRGQLCP